MACRFGGEHAGEIGADHQPADAGVAAKELVGHGDEADVVPVKRCDQRLEHLGTQLAGQDADRRRAPWREDDR